MFKVCWVFNDHFIAYFLLSVSLENLQNKSVFGEDMDMSKIIRWRGFFYRCHMCKTLTLTSRISVQIFSEDAYQYET